MCVKKTRQVTSKEDYTCPVHNLVVSHKVRTKEDSSGKRKYAGEYYGCPQYKECGYYVSGEGHCPTIDAVMERL